MIPMLEGQQNRLNLTPQDFFTNNEFPITKDFQELQTWFDSHFGNVAIPIILAVFFSLRASLDDL